MPGEALKHNHVIDMGLGFCLKNYLGFVEYLNFNLKHQHLKILIFSMLVTEPGNRTLLTLALF